MKTVTLCCSTCGQSFLKEKKEHTRRVKKGITKFYCSNSCGAKAANAPKRCVMVDKTCAYCGIIFSTSSHCKSIIVEHCSRKCASLNSVTELRRESAKMSPGRPENFLSKHEGLKRREAWKYATLCEYFNAIGILPTEFEFEYPIDNRVYDLALKPKKLLIEFDGPDHQRPRTVLLDLAKQKLAAKNGWRVVHIACVPNVVIDPKSIEDLLIKEGFVRE